MQLAEKMGRMDTLEAIATTIAHEVKSPLALVQASVDYLRLGETSEEHLRYYDIISREVSKANELVGDFLNLIRALYRMDEDVEVYDLLMNTAHDYKAWASIYIDCPDKNLYVRGNRKLLSWVVSNIVKNALEAASGKSTVKISAYASGNENVIIEFLDNGFGLSRELLELINEGRIVTTKQEGSGIGISICKNIILDHGGSYCIKNTSTGCLVSISLPIY